jgi:hypothetical protein
LKSRIDRKIFKGNSLKKKINKEYLISIEYYVECEEYKELILQRIILRGKEL